MWLIRFLIKTLGFILSAFGLYRRRGFDNRTYLRGLKYARFSKKPLMNRGEYRVFRNIETEVKRLRPSYRVMAQVNIGEFINVDRGARDGINSKRVDILVIDESGLAVVAVEVQGSGHYQGDAVVRDEIKRTACEKAGVGFVEAFPNNSSDHYLNDVKSFL